ncbi:hypothetical protein, partial [Phascolarctobacterium sp.]
MSCETGATGNFGGYQNVWAITKPNCVENICSYVLWGVQQCYNDNRYNLFKIFLIKSFKNTQKLNGVLGRV